MMKILIVYATKYGSVEKCANILREKIDTKTTVVNIKKDIVPELHMYDVILLGGSIYMGKIQKKIRKFCDQNIAVLLKKRIGLFICAGEKGERKYEYMKNAFSEKLYDYALSKRVFGDELYYEKLNVIEKIMVQHLKGVKASYSQLSIEEIEAFLDDIGIKSTEKTSIASVQ